MQNENEVPEIPGANSFPEIIRFPEEEKGVMNHHNAVQEPLSNN